MKRNYLTLWLILNIFTWLTGILYLSLKTPVYTSEWIVNLPGKGKSTSVNLPDIGVADSRIDSPYDFYADPRENYSSLLKNKEVIRNAAQMMNLSVREFQKPKVKMVDNTTMMELSIDGETPEIARQKAVSLNTALQEKLNQLRKAEIEHLNQNLAQVLENSQTNLRQAKNRYYAHQAETDLNGGQQLSDMSMNIEELRKSRSQILAEIQQNQAFISQLSAQVGLSPQDAAEAMALQSNSVFNEYLAQYSKASAALIAASAKYQPSHPQYIALKEDKETSEAALIAQSQSILGRPVSDDTINLLNKYTRNVDTQQDSIFKQLVAAQAKQKGLESQAQGLKEQIDNLQRKLKDLTQEESTVETLRNELKVAETVFSTNLTNLNLERANVFASYPPLQLFTAPTLPEDPSSPNTKLTLLGMMFSSVCFTTGLLYLRNNDLSSHETRADLEYSVLQAELEGDFKPRLERARENGNGNGNRRSKLLTEERNRPPVGNSSNGRNSQSDSDNHHNSPQ